MPKKKEKKSGDKQDESKKTQKNQSSVTPVDKTGSEDKEKEIYLTQIRYLNERLEGYQQKCDELERQNKDLTSQHSTLEREKKDIVGFLKRSLLEKEAEVDDLLERLEGQRQAADRDRDALQLQHSQLRQELQDRIDELAGENATLMERLASLEEFQKQKEKLMSHMESLEKQLAAQREEHKDDIHSLEMKALLEKKRLEKEMASHAAAMAAEVQHLVDQKVPEATRLALQENTEVKARFSQLSEQAQVLMEKNAALRGRKGQLSVDVDVLEQMLSKVSRTSCIRKKVVEQLTEKCQQLQAEQKNSRQQLEQLQTEHTGVLAEMEAIRHDRASASMQCSEIKAEVGRLEVQLQEERKRRSRMKTTMQEVAITIRQILMEAPVELDSVFQWRQLMQKLLVDLDRHTFTDSTAENDQLNDLQTSDPIAARTVSSDPDLSRLLHLAAHDRPRDHSHLPRRSPKHKNIISRTGAAANSIHLPLHRKPSSQKKLG